MPRASRPALAAAPPWHSPFPPSVAFQCAGPGDPVPPVLQQERALLGPAAAALRVAELARGRACARAALAALEPARAAELGAAPILRADARRPRWPEGFVGSITHHRGAAAAAVGHAADYLGLGLDLEALRAPSPGLLRRILRPEERARWEQTPTAAQPAHFAAVFSAKESVFKALYPHTGIYLGFQDAAIEWDGQLGEETPLRWRLHKACGPGLPAGHGGPGCLLLQDGHVLSAVWLRRG